MRRIGFGIAMLGVGGAVTALALAGAAPADTPADALPVATDAALDADSEPTAEEIDAPEPTPEETIALPALTVDAAEPAPVIDARTAGMVFVTAPADAPGRLLEEVKSIAVIRAHLAAGDTSRALASAERYAETHGGSRERDAAWMVVGLLHREEGRHNSAADAFRRVRSGDRVLAPLGAWYEAEQDLARGKPATAVKGCEDYRTKWPEGLHADACLEVVARGYAAQGKEKAARTAAEAWDDDHPKAPIGEHIELQLALWESEHAVARAIPHLRDLAVSHRTPLAGRVAEERLAELFAAGHAGAVLPTDTWSRQARAVSLRESGRNAEAWALYEELRAEASDNPRLARWVEDQAPLFAWRTRRFEFLAEHYAARYEKKPTARDAWEIQVAYGRAGRWKDAAAWCKKGLEHHPGTREWRRKEEDIGRVYLLAGEPGAARDILDVAALRPGPSGRRAQYTAAFAAYRAGEHEDAVTRFTAVIDKKREHVTEAHYWRAKAYEALGRADEAAADREWIATHDAWSWEGLLLARGLAPDAAPFRRDGTWPGPELPALPEVSASVAPTLAAPVASFTPPAIHAASTGFLSLVWSGAGASDLATPLAAPVPTLARDLLAPPASYAPGALYDEKKAGDALKKLVETHGEAFPELATIYDLSRVGLYDLSGPLFAQLHEDVTKWARQSRSPRYLAARALTAEVEWEPLFLYTRDHHHTARFLYGNWNAVDTPELKRDALRLAWPLAHDRYVWNHAREHAIDPYLVMGLMRQESTYNPIAVSSAGARGAMQIMPKTGHLLADLAHDTTFSAGDLEDPVFAVGYGITYIGLLMERFGGSFPAAAAAYNAGPHNVSRWLAGEGFRGEDGAVEAPIDVFVESIPYRETRHYVKQVSSNYGTYVALYAPKGTRVRVPDDVRSNDATVVDF